MKIRISIFCALAIGLSLKATAQSNLYRKVTISSIAHQRIGFILKKIETVGQFTFAYNNRTVPADSVISLNDFNGTIYSFLMTTLGPDYEFKEVPGYIVLRHTPNKMVLDATIDNTKDQQLTIKGQVFNLAGMQPLKQVSVYEKNQLVAALTNDRGEFELKVKKESGSIILTATKENFRDTSALFLQEIQINSKKKITYRYYPGAAVGKLRKGFAKLLIGSRQDIQNMNLGGFFAFSPFQVSLTPGLSTHGMYSSQVVDHVSLNLLAGYTAGVQGVELAGVFNIDRWDVSSYQGAGVFNIVGGDMSGLQLAGLYNHVVHNATGLQAAGIANSADEVNGVQIAGLFNVAKKVKGVQIAGLFNIADSSDYPIAPVNFIRNGRKSLSLSYDESNYMRLDFRSGGRILYGLIGAGYRFNKGDQYALDAGFGAHLINRRFFTLDGEYVYEASASFSANSYQLSAFRLLAGLKLSRRLELFAGPDMNIASYSTSDQINLNGWPVHKFVNGNNITNIYAGLTGGMQLTW